MLLSTESAMGWPLGMRTEEDQSLFVVHQPVVESLNPLFCCRYLASESRPSPFTRRIVCVYKLREMIVRGRYPQERPGFRGYKISSSSLAVMMVLLNLLFCYRL